MELLGILLSILGIWIGIYLYLRQDRKEQAEKYGSILKQLRELSKTVNRIEERLDTIDQSTNNVQNKLIEAQISLVQQFTTFHLHPKTPPPPQIIDPVLAKQMEALSSEQGRK